MPNLAPARRTRTVTALAAGVVLTGLVGFAGLVTPTADAVAATPRHPKVSFKALTGTVDGTFTFVDCPPGSAAGDFCLTDDITGRLKPLGQVTGQFAVTIHYGRIDGDCAPITKTGTFTGSQGDTLAIEAVGTYCNTPAIAAYVITSATGTGRLAGFTGNGTWVVPPPAELTETGGSGPETLTGLLVPRPADRTRPALVSTTT